MWDVCTEDTEDGAGCHRQSGCRETHSVRRWGPCNDRLTARYHAPRREASLIQHMAMLWAKHTGNHLDWCSGPHLISRLDLSAIGSARNSNPDAALGNTLGTLLGMCYRWLRGGATVGAVVRTTVGNLLEPAAATLRKAARTARGRPLGWSAERWGTCSRPHWGSPWLRSSGGDRWRESCSAAHPE